jgi:hypothetical protein
LTSASAVSHGYYKQIRPTGVDPDPTPMLFLATLVGTALGYGIPVLPILVIQSHSRHGIRTVIPLAIPEIAANQVPHLFKVQLYIIYNTSTTKHEVK